jgi:AraC-like DNA-binding protein
MERIQWARGAAAAAVAIEVEHFGWRGPQRGRQRYPRGNGAWCLRVFHHPTELWAGGDRTVTSQETVVVCSPEGFLGHAAAGGRGEHSWIRLAGAVVPALVRRWRIPCDTPIAFAGADQRRASAELWRDVDAAVRLRPAPAYQILEALLRLYLARLAEVVATPAAGSGIPPALHAAKARIERDYLSPLGLTTLAAEAGLSRAHFATRFKACFGVSPIDYVLRLRIQHAQSLLADPDLPVAAIAAACGYEDPFVFSKLFKRHTGTSPSAWRARILGDG